MLVPCQPAYFIIIMIIVVHVQWCRASDYQTWFILPQLLLQVHFKVAACGRLLQAQAGMHISFKLDEQANHSAGALLKNCRS